MDNQSFSTDKKPTIFGIFGLPATSKTTLLNRLRKGSEATSFKFYDGSDVIDDVVPGGLNAFKNLTEDEKKGCRQEAILKIGKECTESGKVGVVAGHCMFWPENNEAGDWIVTEADLATHTHFIYLDLPVGMIAERRRHDTERVREVVSETHLTNWQRQEKERLHKVCREHDILLSILRSEIDSLLSKNRTLFRDVEGRTEATNLEIDVLRWKTWTLLRDFKDHTEEANLLRAKVQLDEIVGSSKPKTMLVIDGDRTLAAENTGPIFFKKAAGLVGRPANENDPLRNLLSSPMQ